MCCVLGDEERIFQLKQLIATLKQRISDVEYRNTELEELSQISIKKEGMSIVPTIASAYLFGVYHIRSIRRHSRLVAAPPKVLNEIITACK